MVNGDSCGVVWRQDGVQAAIITSPCELVNRRLGDASRSEPVHLTMLVENHGDICRDK